MREVATTDQVLDVAAAVDEFASNVRYVATMSHSGGRPATRRWRRGCGLRERCGSSRQQESARAGSKRHVALDVFARPDLQLDRLELKPRHAEAPLKEKERSLLCGYPVATAWK